jgi:hypothetical protein
MIYVSESVKNITELQNQARSLRLYVYLSRSDSKLYI